MDGIVRVSVVATGIDADAASHARQTVHEHSQEEIPSDHTDDTNEFDDVLTTNTDESAEGEALTSSEEEGTETSHVTLSSEIPAYEEAPKRKLSFFERLTGRRKAETPTAYDERPAKRPRTELNSNTEPLEEGTSENLEIPAFLRRKK